MNKAIKRVPLDACNLSKWDWNLGMTISHFRQNVGKNEGLPYSAFPVFYKDHRLSAATLK